MLAARSFRPPDGCDPAAGIGGIFEAPWPSAFRTRRGIPVFNAAEDPEVVAILPPDAAGILLLKCHQNVTKHSNIS